VEEAQPNFIYRASQAPDDPYYYLQWGQENVGDNSAHTLFGLQGPDPRLSGADMDAESARDLYSSFPMQQVIVAVIDTGVAWDHPDLAPVIWVNPGEVPGNGLDDDGNGYTDDMRGWDFASDDNGPLDAAPRKPASRVSSAPSGQQRGRDRRQHHDRTLRFLGATLDPRRRDDGLTGLKTARAFNASAAAPSTRRCRMR
jgi:subtilisin family serine protease